MIYQFIGLIFVAASASAGLSYAEIGGQGSLALALPIKGQALDYYTPAQYEFKYGVEDPKTGDNKQQSEVRIGDTVKGQYSLAEPDGTIRIVKYTADKINGFNAVVSRIGQAGHPQLYAQKSIAIPLALSHGNLGLENY